MPEDSEVVTNVAKPKTERELAKERAKADKLAKFAEKQRKAEEREKAKAEKLAKGEENKKTTKGAKGTAEKVIVTEYHWRTKAGDKKGTKIKGKFNGGGGGPEYCNFDELKFAKNYHAFKI